MGGVGELAWALTGVEVEAKAEAQAEAQAAREAATAEAAAAAEGARAAAAAAEAEAAASWRLGEDAGTQAAERRVAVAKEGYTGHRLCRYSAPRSHAEGQRSSRALEVRSPPHAPATHRLPHRDQCRC